MTTPMLNLAPRVMHTEHPFWHRPHPTVAVINLDSGYQRLRSEFPRSWQALVRAKSALDSISSLNRPLIQNIEEYRDRIRPLLDLVARDLGDVASKERGRGAELLCAQAGEAAEAAFSYARTGIWPRMHLDAPDDSQPWLFCGPLTPWAMQDGYEPLTLLVAEPQEDAQAAIELANSHLSSLERTVARTLDHEIFRRQSLPDMRAVTLLLAGGISAYGHKNFAHFFPLDAPAGTVRNNEFTVVFANVHRERLRRCSIRMLEEVGKAYAPAGMLEEVLSASITWFRGHDIAHFWKTREQEGIGPETEIGSPFERLILEEARSDTLGLVSVADLLEPDVLGVAFSSEMLRYLSRDHTEFADSGAAMLELGWLEERTNPDWSSPRSWLTTTLPIMAEAAAALSNALDHGGQFLPPIQQALNAGSGSAVRWSYLFSDAPSDVDYTFG